MVAVEQAASRDPWSLSQFTASSLRENEHSLVVEGAAGNILGFAIFQQVLGEATLMNIAVHPQHQGRGLGVRLVTALLAALAGRAVKRCLLEVRASNERAIALYRKHGFIDDGLRSNYYPSATGREDALLMSCNLDTN
jgi:ribosomal-protein-alanine N-acetyltransferase